MGTNVREQLFAKVETLNTILRFIEGSKTEGLSVEDVEKYLKAMKENYKQAYELINRTPNN